MLHKPTLTHYTQEDSKDNYVNKQKYFLAMQTAVIYSTSWLIVSNAFEKSIITHLTLAIDQQCQLDRPMQMLCYL